MNKLNKKKKNIIRGLLKIKKLRDEIEKYRDMSLTIDNRCIDEFQLYDIRELFCEWSTKERSSYDYPVEIYNTINLNGEETRIYSIHERNEF